MLTELQNRGVKDIFIACVDGLSGLPEAIETVYPQTRVQLCMVHLVRNSLRYVSYKHMKAVATDLNVVQNSGSLPLTRQCTRKSVCVHVYIRRKTEMLKANMRESHPWQPKTA